MNEYISRIRSLQKESVEVDLSDPRYRLLLFDFHGTLADRQLWPLRALYKSWIQTFGIPPHRDVSARALYRGDITYKQYLSQLLTNDQEKELLLRNFSQAMLHTYVPMPGMRAVMKRFIQAGISAAILTNGPKTEEIRGVLTRWGLPELSDCVYNGSVMQVKKPDPRAVTNIIDCFRSEGIDATEQNTLVIGDQFEDTQVAQNAGVDSVLMVRPLDSRAVYIEAPYPTYVVDNPFELVEIVAGKKTTLAEEDQTVFVQSPFFNT